MRPEGPSRVESMFGFQVCTKSATQTYRASEIDFLTAENLCVMVMVYSSWRSRWTDRAFGFQLQMNRRETRPGMGSGKELMLRDITIIKFPPSVVCNFSKNRDKYKRTKKERGEEKRKEA